VPIKFKESERIINRVRGQRMNTAGAKNKKFKHFYMRDIPLAELEATINNDRKTPKLKQKCRNEIVRRGYKMIWKMPDGTQIPKEHKALREYIKEQNNKSHDG